MIPVNAAFREYSVDAANRLPVLILGTLFCSAGAHTVLTDQPTMAEITEVFRQNQLRLKQLIRLRLHPRLQGRLDESDVLQDAFVDAVRRLPEYCADPAVPVFVWLRTLTLQRLVDLHRRHFGAQLRDATREISLYRGPLPEISSIALAEQLAGHLVTASNEAIRAETQVAVQAALNAMLPQDREVLALRHFESLTNEEVAHVLELKKSAASNRYIRALRKLKELLGERGFRD